MYAHCVYCRAIKFTPDVAEVETWATEHEQLIGRHSVKVEGYEDDPVRSP